jgi:alkylation response protein AidB-like acyl-CoA dehydrogenase
LTRPLETSVEQQGESLRLTYDEQTEAFRAELRAWLDEHLPDPSQTTERPTSTAGPPPWARELQRKMFDDGWLVPGYPPELGGRNAGLFEQMVYLEELESRGVQRSFNPQGIGIIAASIVSFGTEEQIQRWAVPILRAEKTAALGMSEPGAGSDLAGLSTRAVLDGDHFVVNGQKVWTSGAHDADVLLVFVRTDPDVPKHRGISALVMDADTPGVTRRPFADITGIDHRDFNEVFFDDALVPRENLVGELNDGWRVCTGALGHERAMLWVTWSTGLNTMVRDFARQIQGARTAEDAVTLDHFAKVVMDAHAIRLLGTRGLAKLERGMIPHEQSILKLMGSEAQREMALVATESLGALSIDQDVATSERQAWANNARNVSWFERYLFGFAGTISGGTSEIQRNIVAEHTLGLPRG